MPDDSTPKRIYLSFRTICTGEKRGRVDPTKMHYHTEAHFLLVLEGAETLAFPGGEETTLRAGDAAFVNALQLHATKPLTAEARPRTFCLGLAPSSATYWPAQCLPFRSPIVGDPGMRHLVFRKGDGGLNGTILHGLAELAAPKSLDVATEQATLHRIVSALLELASPRLSIGDRDFRKRLDAFVALRDAVLRGCSTPALAPEAFAAAEGLSIRRANGLFREFIGTTLGSFLRESRIRAAAWEIGHGRTTIREAAGKYGFSSPSNFARELRLRYKTSPIMLRDNR